MKRRIAWILVAVVCVASVATFLMLRDRGNGPSVTLPNPNGYHDFAAAPQWFVGWRGDLLTMPPEEIRGLLKQNSMTLGTIRQGLIKESAVPVTNDLNWFSTHMLQLSEHKLITQLLVAEGAIHLQEGRTNEAASSFTDCIAFAHAAHRHGLMVDELVGMACQSIGARQLVQVAPHIQEDELRDIIRELMALDAAREPVAAVLERDRACSRGSYGFLRTTWMRIVTRRSLRDQEARFKKKHARSIAELRLVMTELALQGYGVRHGKPPAALTDLVPGWLPAVPIDPFSKRPLTYRLTPESYLLYSVGPDAKDDGGIPLKRGGPEQGDLLPTAL